MLGNYYAYSIMDLKDSAFAEHILDEVPISIWVEDFTYPKRRIEKLKQEGITDFRAYMDAHPEFVQDCLKNTEVLYVNKETIRLTHAGTKDDLTCPLIEHLAAESLPVYRDELLLIAEDRTSMEMEFPARTIDGESLTINFRMSIPPIPEEQHRTLILISMLDITRRVHAEKNLRDSLEEKEVLLKEIHHRVKNNLSLINSLIRLFGAGKHWPDIDEITNRIQAISRIHETIYRSDNLSSVDFAEYLEEIVSSFKDLYIGEKAADIRLDVDHALLNINTAVPLGLILTELVTNAQKHAFTDRKQPGTIEISLKEKNGRYILGVSDNGKGFDRSELTEDRGHLGFTLVEALTEQIGGTLDYKTVPGTTFTVTFDQSPV